EPLWKLPDSYSGLRRCRDLDIGRWCAQLNRRNVEQYAQLFCQPWFVDILATRQPVVEARHQNRVVRKIQHGSWTKRSDQLALTNLAVRPLSSGSPAHSVSSSSISTPSMVRSQRFTSGSTSRMERFARNFRWRAGSLFRSGCRNS